VNGKNTGWAIKGVICDFNGINWAMPWSIMHII